MQILLEDRDLTAQVPGATKVISYSVRARSEDALAGLRDALRLALTVGLRRGTLLRQRLSELFGDVDLLGRSFSSYLAAYVLWPS